MGWIYQYALIDRTGGHDLVGLRSIQDWFLRYELISVQVRPSYEQLRES